LFFFKGVTMQTLGLAFRKGSVMPSVSSPSIHMSGEAHAQGTEKHKTTNNKPYIVSDKPG
jgi:hypothetical protein